MVTPELILSHLPRYRDEWELIKKRQYVPDIVKEVCAAHVLFAPYYDQFSYLFYSDDPDRVCEELHRYCKNFIEYKEEPIEIQTSALPTGIVYNGVGDCKHFALFNAGVISSLNRLYGCCFDAVFVFAGYRGATEPHHVFVAVRDSDETEIWLDPTPGSGGTPTLFVEKKV
jgi:hypothetical protein